MLKLVLSSMAFAGLLIASSADAEQITFPPGGAYFDFEDFDPAPGGFIPIGASYQIGDFKLDAVLPNRTPCAAADCLNVGAADYAGLNSPHGNYLFVKSGYLLRLSDVTGTNLVIHSGKVAGIFGNHPCCIDMLDRNNNNYVESLTPTDGPFANFSIFDFLGQPVINDVWVLNINGQVGYDHLKLSRNVPEPSTWALMIVGLGLAGAAMRRRVRAA